MTTNEWLIIAAGLAVGWAAVSFLFRAGGPPPRKPWEEVADALAEGQGDAARWREVLGVAAGADPEAIQAAYERRLAELSGRVPPVETAPERERRERRLAVLRTARDRGLAESAPASE